MSETTPRLGLPLLAAGQAQKEIFHNEALALLDAATQARVESVGLAAPPTGPAAGQCWIVGAGGSGAWAGQSGRIAVWSDGGWRFLPATDGMAVWSAADNLWVYRRGGAWVKGELPVAKLLIGGQQVVGARGANITVPTGGTSIDAEARTAISAVISALVAHGLIAA
jgi:hypothetical protein